MSEPGYFSWYETIHFERDDAGILVMRLHSDGGPVRYSSQHHADWVNAFYDVGADRDNRIVILTGTGDEFINQMEPDGFSMTSAADWETIHSEGKRLLRNLIDIEVPVIGAINGPASIHAELAVLSDITIASSTAFFQDAPHYPMFTVPGDGVHAVWDELIGSNRARYFLLTGQKITADEARSLGVVNEVVGPDLVLDRARELAAQVIQVPPLVSRYTRTVFTAKWKRLLEESLGYGLALEGLATLEIIARMQGEN